MSKETPTSTELQTAYLQAVTFAKKALDSCVRRGATEDDLIRAHQALTEAGELLRKATSK